MLLMPHPVSSTSSERANCGTKSRAAATSDRAIVRAFPACDPALRFLGDVVLGIRHVARPDHQRLVGNCRLIGRAAEASVQAREHRPLRLVQEPHLNPAILVLLDTIARRSRAS